MEAGLKYLDLAYHSAKDWNDCLRGFVDGGGPMPALVGAGVTEDNFMISWFLWHIPHSKKLNMELGRAKSEILATLSCCGSCHIIRTGNCFAVK